MRWAVECAGKARQLGALGALGGANRQARPPNRHKHVHESKQACLHVHVRQHTRTQTHTHTRTHTHTPRVCSCNTTCTLHACLGTVYGCRQSPLAAASRRPCCRQRLATHAAVQALPRRLAWAWHRAARPSRALPLLPVMTPLQGMLQVGCDLEGGASTATAAWKLCCK